jgi:hypothetical protein
MIADTGYGNIESTPTMTLRDSSPIFPTHSATHAPREHASCSPDFTTLLADALVRKQPVPLEQARQLVGAWFDESELAYETLVIRGAALSLTPATWRRVLRRAKTLHDQMTPTTADRLR